jgi:hypothetical protein
VLAGLPVAGLRARRARLAHAGRAVAVAAIVLAAIAWRTGRRGLLLAAAIGLGASALLVGTALRSGAVVAILAAALLVVAWRAGRPRDAAAGGSDGPAPDARGAAPAPAAPGA